jgi:hypothetical protein
MKVLGTLALVGVICATASGCGNQHQSQYQSQSPLRPASQEGPAGAIERVLVQDHNYDVQARHLRQIGYKHVDVVNWIVPRISSIDTSNCPTDFRMAYLRHCQAWQDFAERLRHVSRDWAERAAIVLFKAYATKSVETESIQQLLHPLRQGVMAIHSTWNEVQATAIQNGARIH